MWSAASPGRDLQQGPLSGTWRRASASGPATLGAGGGGRAWSAGPTLEPASEAHRAGSKASLRRSQRCFLTCEMGASEPRGRMSGGGAGHHQCPAAAQQTHCCVPRGLGFLLWHQRREPQFPGPTRNQGSQPLVSLPSTALWADPALPLLLTPAQVFPQERRRPEGQSHRWSGREKSLRPPGPGSARSKGRGGRLWLAPAPAAGGGFPGTLSMGGQGQV